MNFSQAIHVVDSHTAGEPTRVVLSGGPDLPNLTLREKVEALRAHHDEFRTAVICEPRGSDVLVGALLTPPVDSSCAAGVIFFNNVGYLGMCGHGTIGVVATLGHLGKLQAGTHRIETPVGIVSATLHESGAVSVKNIPSYRWAKGVAVDVPGYGVVTGDIAWGGNWFFLCQDHGLAVTFANRDALTDLSWRIRLALTEAGITGKDGGEIDHVELFGPPEHPDADSKNFVLCPGKAYDRSPCGTGTSAKLACLFADGKLAPGAVWRQESIIGSVFEGSVEVEGDALVPTITGSAYITADANLILDATDPFRMGIS
jgi:4-hydroxyproline epimerase